MCARSRSTQDVPILASEAFLHENRSIVTVLPVIAAQEPAMSTPGRGFSCLEACADYLHVVFRSFLLLQLLAFARLWVQAVPLRVERKFLNRSIRSARRSLLGAPLCLALAFCVTTTAAMPNEGVAASAVHHAAALGGRPDGDPGASGRPLTECTAEATDESRHATAGPAPPADEVDLGEVGGTLADHERARQVVNPEPPELTHFPVCVLHYQTWSRCTAVPFGQRHSVDDVFDHAEEQMDAHLEEARVW